MQARSAVLLRSNYSRYWKAVVGKAGQLGLHSHDVRHTANSFVGSSASLRELMTRMGHASQHADREREREITEALSRRIEAVRRRRSGTGVARGRLGRGG
jgi:integrase